MSTGNKVPGGLPLDLDMQIEGLKASHNELVKMVSEERAQLEKSHALYEVVKQAISEYQTLLEQLGVETYEEALAKIAELKAK